MVSSQMGIENNESTSRLLMRNSLIPLLKKRFRTYGYIETCTGTFQDYDLYSTVVGTVHKRDMIKTIDPSGDVRVLRPDVTIPIAQQMASNETMPRRQFYVQDVFRVSGDKNSHKALTQAGVECFGENTHENDAEIIAMAAHILKDLQFNKFKIVISHASFFRELLNQLPITPEQSKQLQELIQSKNMAEISPFLKNLPIGEELATAVEAIPMLYGSPEQVLAKAQTISMNSTMQQAITNLKAMSSILKAYGVDDAVVFDLGMINDMNYYSGVIFQGYVTESSKPVLMGGRYNDLVEQFGKRMPAIGFGCFADRLLEALEKDGKPPQMEIPVQLIIYYDQDSVNQALSTAGALRDDGFRVVTVNNNRGTYPETSQLGNAVITTDHCLLNHQGKQTTFRTVDDLKTLLEIEMREN
ncbi:ATP phosphoribosyltransferase regulatory subunit [Lentibacillus cibarius]|uniref:ATP phosphoribosyltransferase regulatory subunit n=1 Tax=Lentibacillus cibarius TaxID=2583219 RepID=A0A549YHF8_9BACI|nr:ATP phosphoribosyltransferase regulatory subunit [Lentibacillus cibarius]TMN22522.1 ATP phosphoribosyltransferase regulatory subunit [Lentibacillus cibarius]TRM11319.1 ATP phosphoribosyltransferase regulatory subunit [Lentibacillus cibarius]